MASIKSHRELRVYQSARAAAAYVFQLTLKFPIDEKYGATSQSRSSSRSVCANLGEAWRKRRYPAAFRSKLSDAEGEAAETQIWLDLALDCGYITKEQHAHADDLYEKILGQIVNMMAQAESFASISAPPKTPRHPRAPAPRRSG